MNINTIKAALLSLLVTGAVFSLLTFVFVSQRVLSFNSPILAGLSAFLVPAIAIGLYQFLNDRFPNNALEKYSLLTSNLLLGLCVALLFFGYQKWYTAITFFTLFVLLFFIEYKNKLRFMYRFYRCYVLLLIPFYITATVLHKKGTVKFSEAATLKLKLGHIGIEAYFYFMAMLLFAVYFFEFFKRKPGKANG
ncbi:lycopene cyclase domain-containing protein [Pedobacter africanus]|uniref:Lycopene cyclase domain-containing protein n=1 Tax=Pedobacter africanus TaxID=151894 RepID=A0A1W2C0I8_9SPHI|nr:lycopene cyclase domain-containing protein [Pedobacter africanus]SMC78238.1 hypothetical protein SAMN04488524_2772 [Pedobacter africanus]